MENVEIARILNDYADLLDIQGDNPFRVRSYRKAAQSLENLSRPVTELLKSGEEITDIPGIGSNMAEHLHEILETGTLSSFQELQSTVPGSLIDLLRLDHLGPKKVKQLYTDLGTTSIATLKKALDSGKVETLSGFGSTTVKKIKQTIQECEQHAQRFKLADADQLIRSVLEYMRDAPGVESLDVAGSYRRRKETIGDLDILIACKKPKPVMQHFTKFSSTKRVESAGTTRGTIVLRSGLQVDLRILPRESYGSALHYFTGSKSQNIAIRKIGVEKGLRINEYGVFRMPKGTQVSKRKPTEGRRIGGAKEQDVYKAVGMVWVPPELRENRGEIEAAQQNRLPTLIELGDIRGNLHMHSTWSDGKQTIEDMVRACQDLDYQFCAITDHSRSTRIAGGLSVTDLKRQWDEIQKVRERVKGIHLLASAEVDIRPDGSLDYPDDILEKLDIVVASVHSRLTMSKRDMTKRVIKAISHPAVDIIGHPTARQINGREAIALDLEEVFHTAKEHDVALELNAQPKRLDLNDVYVKRAKTLGVKIAINSDAHNIDSLTYMQYGIDQARRGWLEKGDVVNTFTWRKLGKWLGRRR